MLARREVKVICIILTRREVMVICIIYTPPQTFSTIVEGSKRRYCEKDSIEHEEWRENSYQSLGTNIKKVTRLFRNSYCDFHLIYFHGVL